jgi:hypothetical protein
LHERSIETKVKLGGNTVKNEDAVGIAKDKNSTPEALEP